MACDSARWFDGRLQVKSLSWRGHRIDTALTLYPDSMRLTGRGIEGSVALESQAERVTGALRWKGQRIEIRAQFRPTGWLPYDATGRADEITLAGEQISLGGLFSTVSGRAKVEWRHDRLQGELAIRAQPIAGKPISPLVVIVRGQGDAAAITLDAIDLTMPGVEVRLSEPLTIERSGILRPATARLNIMADLGQQPWWDTAGIVRGEARLTDVGAGRPVVVFHLEGRDLTSARWGPPTTVDVEGRLEWPWVRIVAGSATRTSGEKVAWSGGWNGMTGEIEALAMKGEIAGTTLAPWLPPGIAFQRCAFSFLGSGSGNNLQHGGELQVNGLTWGRLRSSVLDLTWSGRGLQRVTWEGGLSTGTSTLRGTGTAEPGAVQITKLDWEHDGAVRLALSAPARLRWSPGWSVDSLRFAGPDAKLEVSGEGGRTGRAEVAATNFSSEWLHELGLWQGPAWRINTLTAKGQWAKGPATFAVQSSATEAPGEAAEVSLVLAIRGSPSGLEIDNLSIVESGISVAQAKGSFPVHVTPMAGAVLSVDESGPIKFEAETLVPSAGAWRHLERLVGWRVEEPKMAANFTGTWDQPIGKIRVSATRVEPVAGHYARGFPVIEGLSGDLSVDATQVQLVEFKANVAGQNVRMDGRLPVARGTWRELLGDPLAALRQGLRAHVTVPDAEVAVFERFLPEFILPQGRVQIDVEANAGALSGEIALRGAATHPWGTLPALQEITVAAVLAGNRISLRAASAQIGGRLVTLTGSVVWPIFTSEIAGAEGATFDLALRGDNLPFVRETGVLVRGDLDLRLTSPGGGPPSITGEVRLRDSLYLSDVRALVPRGARTKAQIPPYFSVEREPFHTWKVDVSMHGERFLKLRTLLFDGVASTRLQISGTLGEPSAKGDVTVERGSVKLPFATFAVEDARVSVGPEMGIEPQVWMTGTARRMSYDLRLEVGGPVSAPVVVFTSSPPLESGQILLMVMAGESPQAEVSISDRQRMARIGTFLGRSLVSSLSSDSELGERLSLTTGEMVSRQGRETYGIEYWLGERWSLVGEYDEFDDFNAGLKWRAYSQGGSGQNGQKP